MESTRRDLRDIHHYLIYVCMCCLLFIFLQNSARTCVLITFGKLQMFMSSKYHLVGRAGLRLLISYSALFSYDFSNVPSWNIILMQTRGSGILLRREARRSRRRSYASRAGDYLSIMFDGECLYITAYRLQESHCKFAGSS